MKFLAFQIILQILVISAFAFDDNVREEDWMNTYFGVLKQMYDKRVAPVGDGGPGSPVNVSVSLYILDIFNVDDSNMDYTALFLFRQVWKDPRLGFLGKNHSIKLRSADEFWTPDFHFMDSRETKLHEIVEPNVMLRILPQGLVFYSIRITVKIPCSFDLRSFPHDTQKCQIRIESHGHNMSSISPDWMKYPAVGISKSITLRNFEIINLNYSHNIYHFNIGTYKTLIVTLTLQRHFGFFAIKLYVPLFLLVIVSFLTLWIRAEERSLRLSLLVIILYFMINISMEASDEIPSVPYTKGSDIWISFCQSLVFAVLLEFIAVALISGRHNTEHLDRTSEILMNMETDSNEQSAKTDSSRFHSWKLLSMFGSRDGSNRRRNVTANQIDKICRFVFPLIFLLFNIVYWSVYC